MKLSKRQFLKLGVGGTAALLLSPGLRPGALFASPVVTPPGYLDSAVHQRWMKLTYNRGRESRQTRRRLGAALRNIGAIKGQGRGFDFARVFDEAVERAFRQSTDVTPNPPSLFERIQRLYDEQIYEQTDGKGGEALFGTLFAILRGRDGTELGEAAHQRYQSYRNASLRHKDARREAGDPKMLHELREERSVRLAEWQAALALMVERYSSRQMSLSPGFTVAPEFLDGFDVYHPPVAPPRLKIARVGNRVRVSWDGPSQLQQGPGPMGPWSPAEQASPALFDLTETKLFFRTVYTKPSAN